MKNTFLKKAGAVALAAVMAVTFAPYRCWQGDGRFG